MHIIQMIRHFLENTYYKKAFKLLISMNQQFVTNFICRNYTYLQNKTLFCRNIIINSIKNPIFNKIIFLIFEIANL